MKLLLIAPRWPEHSLWGQIVFRFPVLSLTTLAALTDGSWETTILDENVAPVDMDAHPDLVGISVMTALAPRAYAIADHFRARGIPVVLGGIHPTMRPDEAREHADAVVIGEAEQLWPTVLSDAADGALQPCYQAQGYADLTCLPIPRRDLLAPKGYFFTNTLQTTRGCPFDCEFCSVTAFHGRTYRVRPVPEVVDEITKMMHGKKRRFLFFVDDNIVGKPDYAKALFKALIPLKIAWLSQASLSIVKDPELLRLAQESGCRGLFIGFESLSQETLKAMRKAPNTAASFADAITTIHDHGIGIQGSFIFGYDHDTPDVFGEVLDFIETQRLEAAIFSVLTPFPGTRVFDQMQADGRILHTDWSKYDMNHVVYQPKGMSPERLQEGLHWAYRRLYGGRSIFKRMIPPNRNFLFFLIQNLGFRRAWQQALKGWNHGA